MRKLEIEIDEVLSLVSCAQDYGFANALLFGAFASWCSGKVSDDEIENYAADFMTPESIAKGFSEEDYDDIKERLTEWRDRYCKKI